MAGDLIVLGPGASVQHSTESHRQSVHRPPFDRLPAIRADALIGRDVERDDLVGRLRRGEDVCVVGPPGFGKTALAAEAIRLAVGKTEADLARSPFPDGLVFLELYQLKADPERVWHTLADRFAPGAHADRPARERAERVCANLHALVVVEGGEEAGDQLPTLLSVLGTQMRRLVLTRDAGQDFTGRPIRLDHELEPAAARALLRRLSPTHGTDAQLEEIVALLGGHPPALTNVGCQLANPDDTVEALLNDLRSAPLDRSVEPGNPRHPLRWSYDRSWRLLSEDARRVLVAAGCLAFAPFGLWAAEAALDCGSPLPLSGAPGVERAPEDWRTPQPGGVVSVPGETPLLLIALAERVVAAFAAAVKAFQDPKAPMFQQPGPVLDALAHATALLAHEAPPVVNLARRLAGLVYGMPQPGQTVVLRPALVEITRQLYERIKAADDAGQPGLKASRARLAGTLANWLSEVGRRVEALGPAQEAVELYRALARANPEAFNPDLAGSLNDLAAILIKLGRREEALGLVQEAIKLFRELPRVNSGAYNLGLVAALNNRAALLRESGRRVQALELAREAVDLSRVLAQANPEAFDPDLARSLNILALLYRDLGWREEALGPVQEAVKLYRALVRTNPDAFDPDLAALLNNLAILLSELGRRAEALGPAQEALELRRALARANPDAFNPDLARSLGMMGHVQEGNGHLEAALACFREGVETLTPAFQRLPEAFRSLMAILAEGYLRVLVGVGREADFAGAEALLAPVLERLKGLGGSGGEQPA